MPSVVVLFEIVGFADVLQHTPRNVTDDPPSLVILPPLVAMVPAIKDTSVVVSVGNVIVLKLT